MLLQHGYIHALQVFVIIITLQRTAMCVCVSRVAGPTPNVISNPIVEFVTQVRVTSFRPLICSSALKLCSHLGETGLLRVLPAVCSLRFTEMGEGWCVWGTKTYGDRLPIEEP